MNPHATRETSLLQGILPAATRKAACSRGAVARGLKPRRLKILPLLLLPALALGPQAAEVTLQYGVTRTPSGTLYTGSYDSWMQEHSKASNHGDETDVTIQYNDGLGDSTAIKFDLPSLTHEGVSAATLSLYYFDYGSMGNDTWLQIKPYRYTASWTEMGVTYKYRDEPTDLKWTGEDWAGWNDKADDSNEVKQLKRLAGDPPAGIPVLNWVGFNVHPSVALWAGGTANNGFGMFQYAAGGDSYCAAFFYSNQYVTDTSLRPKLSVTYSHARISWCGTTSGAWDASSRNWNVGGWVGTFGTGDHVTFPDGAANPTITVASGGVAPAQVTISNNSTTYAFSGGGIGGTASLTKTGTGTATLSTANSYPGATSIAAGALRIQHATALGDTTTGTSVANDARLELAGSIAVGAEPLTLAGTGGGSGALRNVSGNNSWAGSVTLNAAAEIQSDAGTLSLQGPVNGAGYGLTFDGSGAATVGTSGVSGTGTTLTKTGSGTVTLTGANTHTGNTMVSSGTLALTGSGSLASSPVISVASPAVLDVTGRADGLLPVGADQTLTGAGTVNGGVTLQGTLAPASSVGTLATGPQTWSAGGTFAWEINNASGSPGSGWDLTTVSGDLTVSASSASRFAVRLISLNGASPGPAAGFDPDTPYDWTIATLSGSLVNFDPDRFFIDASLFQNDGRGGVFRIAEGSVKLQFLPNRSPVATDPVYHRRTNTILKIKIAELLATATSDPDGDPRELAAFSPLSGNKVPVRRLGDYLYYETKLNSDDTIAYTVRDVRSSYRPQDTYRTATGTIQIHRVDDQTQSLNIVRIQIDEHDRAVLTIAGIPRFSYEIQRTIHLTPPVDWKRLGTMEAPPEGVFVFVDESPPEEEAYYRTVEP